MLAGAFHIGMLAVAASCVATVQFASAGTAFVVLGMLGIGTVALALIARRSGTVQRGMASLTALAAAVVYGMAFEPQLVAVAPALIDRLPMVVWELSPSIGTAGLVLSVVATATYLLSGCDRSGARLQMGGAVLTAAGLVIGLGLLMYVTLAPVYELQGGMYTRLLIGRTLEYTLLGLVVMRMYGLRGVGSAPAWYFAGTLLAVAGRHLLGIGMG